MRGKKAKELRKEEDIYTEIHITAYKNGKLDVSGPKNPILFTNLIKDAVRVHLGQFAKENKPEEKRITLVH